MKLIGKYPVIENVKLSNSKFSYLIETILYYLISFLVFGGVLIGANYLLPFIPKNIDVYTFNKVLSETMLAMLVLFCPVFVFARKKLVDKIKKNAMGELEKLSEGLNKIGVYTTNEELSKGFISRETRTLGYGSLEEISKSLHFKDIKGEYLALRETLYQVGSQITGCDVNLLNKDDYNYEDKEVQKYLLRKKNK